MPLYRVPTQNNAQYTLDSQLAAGGTTLTLNQSVAGIVQAPGVCVIDRVDSSGSKTPSKREYISFTGVSGADLTGLSRGLAGSTDQVHAVSAIVEFVPDVVQEEAKYVWSVKEHDTTGVHASLVSLTVAKTLTLVVASAASVSQLAVNTIFNASGASLLAMPIRPVWAFNGASAATTSIGGPVDMPEAGTIDYVSITLNGPVSGASLLFDLNKNFGSMFDAGTRPTILGGGTFVSTASLAVKTFARGDQLSVDLDAGGWFKAATVRVQAR